MEVLSQILRRTHREAGLYIKEDDHVVSLKVGPKVIARWSARTAKVFDIIAEADRWVEAFTCPVGWGAEHCPGCKYSKEGLCDYPHKGEELGCGETQPSPKARANA